ncbi:MAG: C39 family peptidase, partial [Erysipelotrichaceae bacterium]
IIFLFISFIVVGATSFYVQAENYRIEYNINLEKNIRLSIDNLYIDSSKSYIKDSTTKDDINVIINNINIIEDETTRNKFMVEIDSIKKLFRVNTSINSWLKDGVIIDYIQSKNVKEIKRQVKTAIEANSNCKVELNKRANVVIKQFDNYIAANTSVSTLFNDSGTITSDASNADYEAALAAINLVKNTKLKEDLSNKIKDVPSLIIERDKAEAIRIKKYNENVVKLRVPFINQMANGAPQGCEAASLLMALQYKGNATNISYHSFIDGMPTSDNPEFGFIHSQYDVKPENQPHTINPKPLANYGAKYGNVTDFSGATPEQIRTEIKAGNPVIAYCVTGYFTPIYVNTPYGKQVLNLHVILIIGYDDNTNQYLINDPAFGQNWINYNLFNQSYYTLNSYAVVVR